MFKMEKKEKQMTCNQKQQQKVLSIGGKGTQGRKDRIKTQLLWKYRVLFIWFSIKFNLKSDTETKMTETSELSYILSWWP